MSTEPGSGRVRRRDFLKVLGTAGAASSVVGCDHLRVEKLIPYLVSPDQTVPGVSTYYATTCRECAAGCGVIAETRDGRTIKLEGNPNHPVNRGALCARGQSALQGLYNPDRYRGPMVRSGGTLVPATWDQALQQFSQRLGEARSRGAGGAVFLNQHETGSFPAFLDQWLSGFGMPPHLSVDAEAASATIAANRQAYGVSWPRIDFSAARLIVSFGADFLDGWGASVPQQLDFADARAKLADAPRFVYVGPRRSLTGLNADQWIACKPGSELAIAQALQSGSVDQASSASGVPAATLQALAREIATARPALFLAGGTGPDATDLATAVAALNGANGAAGTVLRTSEGVLSYEGLASHSQLRGLIDRMNTGAVSMLMVRGANPAYTLPKSLGFAAAMAKVPVKISFSSYPDETTELCDLVLPDHHALEQWGDAEPVRGTISLQQPTMDPVFDTMATADVLIRAAQADPASAGRYPVRDYRSWLIGRFPGGQSGITAALTRGVANGSVMSRSAASPAAPANTRQAPAIEQTQGDFYLHVYPSPVLGDGRGGNKPWLQELPDPVTKIAWQSWVEIHPSAARRLGVENGDHLKVDTASGSVTAPAYLYIGIRPDTIGIALGRGHTSYGRYAKGIGVNALDLLPGAEDPRSGALALTSTKARVAKASEHSDLVTIEGSARQHGRGIAQALTIDELGREPAHVGHTYPGDASHEFLPGLKSPVAADAQGVLGSPSREDIGKDKGMYSPNHWSGMANRRWAMTIDLARCTGCSACVTACYAENNIPTVGAPWQGRALSPTSWDERPGANILKGREMNWIRLERYFEGGDDAGAGLDENFEARFVPMLCQHCGNAPCEPVCPVYATYHSPDGLNVQVYNRCVGTRYCSNNCPYKVRYFNWFGYGETDRRQYAFPEPLNWQLNPDVTVRGKGVMEKCTFCVQRIRESENRARMEGRPLQPDEFTTACAEACPSRAITFGDAADPNWTVARLAQDRRAYHVFAELNTFTAVVYLKKLNHAEPASATPAGATGAPGAAAPPPTATPGTPVRH